MELVVKISKLLAQTFYDPFMTGGGNDELNGLIKTVYLFALILPVLDGRVGVAVDSSSLSFNVERHDDFSLRSKIEVYYKNDF